MNEEPIASLHKIFQPLLDQEGIQVFVHGSWADSTRTAFSDLDDFVIIDHSHVNNLDILQNKLDDVELEFQRLDPLQHHGHWIIEKKDLEDYDNSYIPLFILESSISIIGSNELNASVNFGKTKDGLRKNIIDTCKNIEKLFKLHCSGGLNIYNLKCLVGSFVLLPPLIFQLKGKNLDKRSAIHRANEIFTDASLHLIKWSTDLRNNWEQITTHSSYQKYVKELSHYSVAKEWRDYSSSHAPIIDYSALSTIQLDWELVYNFIYEVLTHVDNYQFKSKSIDDYELAYQQLEKFALSRNALAVGRFGNTQWPSISDLDVFICFPDDIYKDGISAVNSLIQRDENLHYILTHPPVYVSKSMMPYLKNLHTLYDLVITSSVKENHLEHGLDYKYKEFLNKVWTYYLLTFINDVDREIKFYDSRFLVLLLKNIHTSIFNLEELLGIKSRALEASVNIRKEFAKYGIGIRTIIEEEFKQAIIDLNTALIKVSKTIKPLRDCIIVGRWLQIYPSNSDVYCSQKDGNKTIITINTFLFNLLYEVYKGNSSNAQLYLKSSLAINKLSKNIGTTNPFISPFPIDFVSYNNAFTYKIKRAIFKEINKLPSPLLKKLVLKI